MRRECSVCLLLFLVLQFGLFLFRAVAQEMTTPRNQEMESSDIERARSEWFYGQRAYPHKHVPAGARVRALKELDFKIAREMAASIAPASNPVWNLIGPRPIDTPFTDPVVSGRISALAVVPNNNSTVYAGAAQGGVWKTTNGGTSWTPLTDSQSSLAIGSIVLDPTDSNIVYVGTGEENFSGDSYYGAGILKSTNGGSSWTHICGPFCGPIAQDGYYGGGARIGGLAVDPANNQVLLGAVALLFKDGIYRSADGGMTWKQVLSGNPGTGVMFDPSGTVAYAAMGNDFSGGTRGVYKSADGGQTWMANNGTGANVLPFASAGRIVLAMSPTNHTTLYAGLANQANGSLLGLYITTDGGANWSRLAATPDYCNPQCSYDHVIAVSPVQHNGKDVIYAGGAFSTTLVRSLDGGSTWTILQSAETGNPSGFMHADLHAMTFAADGSVLYVGNDGGVYSTTGAQITAAVPSFTALNSTLATAQLYPGLSIDPSNSSIAIGGTQDNGTELYSGPSLVWHQVACGDGSATAIDPALTSTMYAVCTQTDIEKSTQSGAFLSWSAAATGINNGEQVEFSPPLALDPSTPENLYFGTQYLYQTVNGAGSWQKISPNLTSNSGFWSVVTAIAVAPSSSNTVYVGTGDSHLWVSNNALLGTSATFMNHSAGLPPRVITDIAVHPTTPTTAYVTFSGFKGFSGDTKGHVFRTTNGGATWTDISSDLPNTPVNAIVINPAAPAQVFVGTDVGVFYTTNGGVSWTTLINGLPRVAILGLALHAPSDTLRASSHGRSVWDLNISSILPVVDITSISPTNALMGSAGFTLTVNGSGYDNSCVVRWNGVALSTTFVSAGQLKATVPSSDLVKAGRFPITIFESSTNQTSNSVAFTVDNPVPTLTSLVPSSATHGGAGFTLTVNGSQFVSGAVVEWNGSARKTTFVSTTQLKAAILASDIASVGKATVKAVNPAPSAGTSNGLTFTIN